DHDGDAAEGGDGTDVDLPGGRLVDEPGAQGDPPHQRDGEQGEQPGHREPRRGGGAHQREPREPGAGAPSGTAWAMASPRMSSSVRCGRQPRAAATLLVSGTRRYMSSNPAS